MKNLQKLHNYPMILLDNRELSVEQLQKKSIHPHRIQFPTRSITQLRWYEKTLTENL